MTLDVEIVTTRSGARAVRDRLTGEVMHSAVGPTIESLTLYVTASRLRERLMETSETSSPLVLLDVGLGAGSNAALSLRVSEELPSTARRLEILSFDRSLAAMELALADQGREEFGFAGIAHDAGRAIVQHGLAETPRTTWRLFLGDLPGTLSHVAPASADIVYWDPFSPKVNPSLWSFASFTGLRRVCRQGATVHTYSQATRVRSALLLAGFHVGMGTATGQKESTTIAGVGAPPGAKLLDRRWLERLGRSSAPFPADAPADAMERIAALPQLAQ